MCQNKPVMVATMPYDCVMEDNPPSDNDHAEFPLCEFHKNAIYWAKLKPSHRFMRRSPQMSTYRVCLAEDFEGFARLAGALR